MNKLDILHENILESDSTEYAEYYTYQFLIALWSQGKDSEECNPMVNAITPYLANCARLTDSASSLAVIANGMRNCYRKGQQS